jgi:hypothetical protein
MSALSVNGEEGGGVSDITSIIRIRVQQQRTS